MSLGIIPNRRIRTSSLPGATAVLETARTPRVQPTPPKRSSLQQELARATKQAPPPLPPAPSPPPPQESPPHWVYAQVLVPLQTETGAQAACGVGERVLLEYPMVTDPVSGTVYMKRKAVQPVTGQLTYEWTTVYDPNSDTRYVGDFSFT
jgi:hypothetical protein